MKRYLLLLSVLYLGVTVQAQQPCSLGTKFRGCRACGTAGSKKGQRLNVQKNRDDKATQPHDITIDDIRNPANNNTFSPNRQVTLTGYVASVEAGGLKESCNCNREDLRDIHINVVADPSEVGDLKKYVIVEITPRWQQTFHLKSNSYDAMLQKVQNELANKWVRFEGWMLYDYIHANESESTAPGKFNKLARYSLGGSPRDDLQGSTWTLNVSQLPQPSLTRSHDVILLVSPTHAIRVSTEIHIL